MQQGAEVEMRALCHVKRRNESIHLRPLRNGIPHVRHLFPIVEITSSRLLRFNTRDHRNYNEAICSPMFEKKHELLTSEPEKNHGYYNTMCTLWKIPSVEYSSELVQHNAMYLWETNVSRNTKLRRDLPPWAVRNIISTIHTRTLMKIQRSRANNWWCEGVTFWSTICSTGIRISGDI